MSSPACGCEEKCPDCECQQKVVRLVRRETPVKEGELIQLDFRRRRRSA